MSDDPTAFLAGLQRQQTEAPHLAPGDDHAADQLLQRIHERIAAAQATPTSRRPRWRRPKTWIVGGSSVIVLFGAGAAVAAILRSAPAAEPQTISCWFDTQATQRWATQRTSADQNPVDLCATPWVNGDFDTDGPPPQVACVSDQGTIAVIPGSPDVCQAVGLPPLDDTQSKPQLDIYDTLNSELIQPLGKGCYSEPETLALLERVVADTGIADWDITQLHPFSPSRPCGAVGIDIATKSIVISPRVS